MTSIIKGIALLFFLSFNGFIYAQVQQEVGLDIALGMSNNADQKNQHEWIHYLPKASTAVALQYNLLFFKNQLNVGLGVGYQTKSYSYMIVEPEYKFEVYSEEHFNQAISVPIELGYRWNISPKHALQADALCIPNWYTRDGFLLSLGDIYPGYIEHKADFGIDVGGQLSYRAQVSPHWSTSIGLRATTTVWETEREKYIFRPQAAPTYYTVMLQLGLHYQFTPAKNL